MAASAAPGACTARPVISRGGLAVLLLLTACGPGPKVRTEVDGVTPLIEKARAEKAAVCSPKAFALAEAHREFAALELKQGNFLRAQDHLAVAAPNAEKALR